ncbi:MAG: hypothetical protein ACK456_10130 [Pseudanabaenaceae cyanobacterium]|jgi:hypothetical protein
MAQTTISDVKEKLRQAHLQHASICEQIEKLERIRDALFRQIGEYESEIESQSDWVEYTSGVMQMRNYHQ